MFVRDGSSFTSRARFQAFCSSSSKSMPRFWLPVEGLHIGGIDDEADDIDMAGVIEDADMEWWWC